MRFLLKSIQNMIKTKLHFKKKKKKEKKKKTQIPNAKSQSDI